jgi:hypothetical protein
MLFRNIGSFNWVRRNARLSRTLASAAWSIIRYRAQGPAGTVGTVRDSSQLVFKVKNPYCSRASTNRRTFPNHEAPVGHATNFGDKYHTVTYLGAYTLLNTTMAEPSAADHNLNLDIFRDSHHTLEHAWLNRSCQDAQTKVFSSN